VRTSGQADDRDAEGDPRGHRPRDPRLRDEGFADIVEGTVYALLLRIEQRGLVDIEKVPSGKGPPRKVFTLNGRGATVLDEFWTTWRFLADRIEQLHDRKDITRGEA
jgi:PadR family transcriptional regulator PadR